MSIDGDGVNDLFTASEVYVLVIYFHVGRNGGCVPLGVVC